VVGDNVFDAISDVVDVFSRDTADRYSAILSHVNAVLLDHSLTLLDCEACKREHTNLCSDVGPVSFDFFLFDGAA